MDEKGDSEDMPKLEDVDSDEEFWENMEESDKVIRRNVCFKPSQAEIDDHMATHIPFRSWCEFCVMGKSRNVSHKSVKSEEDSVPKVSIDYAYLGKSKDKQEDEHKEEDGMPMLVMRDRKSKAVMANIVPAKGEDD